MPHPQVVSKLREWLEQAERGEIQGLVLVADCADGTSQYGWAGTLSSRLVGGVELAKAWIMGNLNED